MFPEYFAPKGFPSWQSWLPWDLTDLWCRSWFLTKTSPFSFGSPFLGLLVGLISERRWPEARVIERRRQRKVECRNILCSRKYSTFLSYSVTQESQILPWTKKFRNHSDFVEPNISLSLTITRLALVQSMKLECIWSQLANFMLIKNRKIVKNCPYHIFLSTYISNIPTFDVGK